MSPSATGRYEYQSTPVIRNNPAIFGIVQGSHSLSVTFGFWGLARSSLSHEWKANKIEISGEIRSSYLPRPADVGSSSTSDIAIDWLASKGISVVAAQFSGKPLFRPTEAESRQAIALFLARYSNIDVTAAPTQRGFADVPIDPPAASAIARMKGSGTRRILSGRAASRFTSRWMPSPARLWRSSYKG